MARKTQQTFGIVFKRIICMKWFKVGICTTSIFYHESKYLRALAHGDDVVVLVDEQGQQFVMKTLSERYSVREEGIIEPDNSDGTELVILNRIVRFVRSTDAVECEADLGHVELVVKQLGLENGKSVATPSEKKSASGIGDALNSKALNSTASSMYRSLTMHCTYG